MCVFGVCECVREVRPRVLLSDHKVVFVFAGVVAT